MSRSEPGIVQALFDAPEQPTERAADAARAALGVRRVVYTDGACIGNPGPGGWAWAASEQEFASGAEAHTTNQRMELSGVIEAVGALEGPLEIVSDSTYVVRCFHDRWWQGWRRRGWRNSKGEPVANRDLWEPLVAEIIDHRGEDGVHFRWVKGHSGEQMNEFVDRLANAAARAQQGSSSRTPSS